MTETVDRPLWEEDGILADRVRSSLGSLLKHLDQPRVHVMSSRGVVSLHGDVSSEAAKAAVEAAAGRVFGVTSVRSHLHVGLRGGECPPSVGRLAERSPLLQRLHAVARDCGFLSDAEQRFVLRAALGVFAARLPDPVQRRFLDHLPHDVRRIAAPRRFLSSAAGSVTTQHDFVQVVAMSALTDHAGAERLLRRVLPELRRHAADDSAAITAVLPAQLRAFWGVDPSERVPAATEPVRHTGDGADVLLRPVSTVMTRRTVTVRPESSLFEAFEVMARAHVHHLPVVDEDGRCVALLDAVTVAERLPEAWVTRGAVSLHRAGAPGPLSVLPGDTIGRTARLMHAAGADACCVVDEHEHLVGILTARDVVAALADAARDG